VKHIDVGNSQYIKELQPTTSKDVEVHEPNNGILTTVQKFFSSLGKYQHNESLKDLATPRTTL
jgi:hypothetical protein